MGDTGDRRADAPPELNWAVTWRAGQPSATDDPAPGIQWHRVSQDFIVLRQNMSVHFEAPFMFLVFGREQALLVDTGATPDPESFPLRAVVDELITSWWAGAVPEGYELLVVHTHGHGDHRAADGQFAERPQTRVVGHGLPDVRDFYGFDDWPVTPRTLDLGQRVLDVIPAPGHHPSATVFYDRASGILLTGDTLYPGRIYVDNWDEFAASVDRLAAWAREHPVSHVVGCHIEMSALGEDYPRGTTHQPDEPPLQLPPESLTELWEAVRVIGGASGIHVFERFQVWNHG